MEFILVICKCAFVLALIASHEIATVQGRQLRPKDKQDLSKLTSSSTGAEQKHDVQAFQLITATTPGEGGNSRPTKSIIKLVLVHKDAFEPAPTTSVKSSGIALSHENENEQIVVEAQGQNSNGRHYVTGDKEEFRPTPPGQIPTNATGFTAIPSPGGIGHGVGKN